MPERPFLRFASPHLQTRRPNQESEFWNVTPCSLTGVSPSCSESKDEPSVKGGLQWDTRCCTALALESSQALRICSESEGIMVLRNVSKLSEYTEWLPK
jgi:hypothetical protein